jgi:hypothetical protein
MLLGRGPCDRLIIVQRSPTECGVVNKFDREASLGEAMNQNRIEKPQEKNTTSIFRVRYIPQYLILEPYVPPKRPCPQPNTSDHIINDHSIDCDM